MFIRVINLFILGALFIGLIFQIPKDRSSSSKREVESLIKQISFKKERSNFSRLLQKIEAESVIYQEMHRTLRYFFDIPGFRKREYLEIQSNLLTHALAASLYGKKLPISDSDRVFSLDGYGYIKNRHTPFLETICWDLSFLFGCSDHIAPTCEILFEKEHVVFQPKVDGKVHNHLLKFTNKEGHRTKFIKRVPFWKFNLFMIALGHTDLIPYNIAINKRGVPLSWDNEYTFSSSNYVSAEKTPPQYTYLLPFVNLMLDYPQALESLSTEEQKKILQLMRQWKSLSKNIELYMTHSYTKHRISPMQLKAIIERVALLTDEVALLKTPILREYIEHQFPDVFIGAEDACSLLKHILDDPVSPLSATLFIYGPRTWWEPLTEDDNTLFNNWIEENHLNK